VDARLVALGGLAEQELAGEEALAGQRLQASCQGCGHGHRIFSGGGPGRL
jgi:hypothetical protein